MAVTVKEMNVNTNVNAENGGGKGQGKKDGKDQGRGMTEKDKEILIQEAVRRAMEAWEYKMNR